MKKILFSTLIVIATCIGSSYAYEIVDSSVFRLDMEVDQLVTSIAPDGEALPLKSLVEQAGGLAGVNGAYFCPDEAAYSGCGGGNKTTAERIVQGSLYSKYGKDTGIRGIIGVTSENDVLFVQNNGGYVGNYKNNTNAQRYEEIYYGIGNFPILLDQGVDVLKYYGDVIESKMKSSSTKSFICHTKDGRYVYMGSVSNKTIYQMPGYLKERYDCYNAINLDAGGSLAMYDNGSYIKGPGRNIVDAFVIKGERTVTEGGRSFDAKTNLKDDKANLVDSSKDISTHNNYEELVDAITLIHSLGITMYDTPNSFMSDQIIRRDEAAAMFLRLASSLDLLSEEIKSSSDCQFNDIENAHNDLIPVVSESCRYGLFQGNNGYFMPRTSITNGQSVTVLTRMLDGYKSEQTGGHRALNYHAYMDHAGYLEGLSAKSINNLSIEISRGDIALILARVYTQNSIENTTMDEDNTVSDEVDSGASFNIKDLLGDY